jgi:hypothetical protein
LNLAAQKEQICFPWGATLDKWPLFCQAKKLGDWVDVDPSTQNRPFLLQVPLFLRLAAKEDKITEKHGADGL